MVEYASTLPMTSTLIGTSRWETMATTTGTGPPSPGRPRPPAPPVFASELLQPARRANVTVATASSRNDLLMFMEIATPVRAPVYKIEEGASVRCERLPGKHNYL